MKKVLSFILAANLMMGAAAWAAAAVPESIFVEADKNNVVLPQGLLTPGETYRFPVWVQQPDGSTAALTEQAMEGYQAKLFNVGEGNSLQNAQLVTSGGRYYLELQVKTGWPAEQVEEEYVLRLIDKADRNERVDYRISFSTGYAQASQAAIAGLQAGDAVQVDPDSPVYTADQVSRIARINRNKRVTLSGDGWQYTGQLDTGRGLNMLYHRQPVEEILEKFPTQDFEFLTFPAGPQFAAMGEMVIDVSDMAGQFDGNFVLYRYWKGRLHKLDATYDAQEQTLAFRTGALGRFVITDREVGDTLVVSGFGGDLQPPR